MAKRKQPATAGSVEAIGAEIKRLEGKRAEQQESLEVARESEAAAESEREQHLVAGLVEGDDAALAKLDELAAAADKAARRRRDVERVIEQLSGKLVELAKAKKAAEIDAARTANAEDGKRAVEIAGRIDECMKALVSDLRELVGIRHAEYRRSAAVGLPEAGGYVRTNHVGQVILWYLAELPLDLPRPPTRTWYSTTLEQAEQARQQGGKHQAAEVVFEEDAPPLEWTAEDEASCTITPAPAG